MRASVSGIRDAGEEVVVVVVVVMEEEGEGGRERCNARAPLPVAATGRSSL